MSILTDMSRLIIPLRFKLFVFVYIFILCVFLFCGTGRAGKGMHVFHGRAMQVWNHCNRFMARFSLSTVQRYDNAAAQSCTFLTSCSTLFTILSSPLYIVRFIYRGMILFFATPLDRIPSKSKKVSYLANMNVFIPGSPVPFLLAQSQRFCMGASVLQGVPDVRAWR